MEDTETIEGYEVKSSVRIGHKRLIFAVHPDEEEQYPYLKCTAIPDGIMVRYENAVASTDCLEALQLFADDIKAECASLEAQRGSCGLEDTSCLTNDELIPVSWEDNIAGKVVAVKEHSLPEAHRDITHQLFYLNSGFGVEARSRGRACYGWDLFTGESVRVERPDVAGIVPDEMIPGFAREKLAEVQKERSKKKDRGNER